MKIAQDIATRQESTIIPERVLRDLVVERWPIDRHIPYVRNARTHTEEQVAQVAASIIEFGWTNPILVGADGVIIAGHARLLAARKLGMNEVPVIVLGHLTEAQRRALVLTDNKLALNAGWDMEMLRVELDSDREARHERGAGDCPRTLDGSSAPRAGAHRQQAGPQRRLGHGDAAGGIGFRSGS